MRFLPLTLILTLGCLLIRPTAADEAPEARLAKLFAGHQGAFVMLDVSRGTFTRFNPDRCRERFSSCSTFKIPNSLFGLETGVIPDAEYRMRWDGTKHPIEPWNRDHTLRTAIADSVVWYYQKLAAMVGMDRMAKHVRALRYGNQDLSGGLTRFWLESSLKISPEEQVEFLRRLHLRELPFSPRSMENVSEIMKLGETEKGVLRGKTGTAGDPRAGIATHGWFVGSVTRGGSAHVFATHIAGGENPSGRTARRITEEILKSYGLY